MRFRLKLKDSFAKLRGERQEDYFDNLRALHRIEPFKHLYAYAILLLLFLFFGYYQALGVLLIFYLAWVVVYWITFFGVKKLYEKSVKEQEIEDVLRKDL